MTGPRRLAEPRPVSVGVDAAGAPAKVGSALVEALREQWLVEDRWWTERPLRRRYFELIDCEGRDLVVFRDLERGRWFIQRG